MDAPDFSIAPLFLAPLSCQLTHPLDNSAPTTNMLLEYTNERLSLTARSYDYDDDPMTHTWKLTPINHDDPNIDGKIYTYTGEQISNTFPQFRQDCKTTRVQIKLEASDGAAAGNDLLYFDFPQKLSHKACSLKKQGTVNKIGSKTYP
jgi:hypothetical protein